MRARALDASVHDGKNWLVNPCGGKSHRAFALGVEDIFRALVWSTQSGERLLYSVSLPQPVLLDRGRPMHPRTTTKATWEDHRQTPWEWLRKLCVRGECGGESEPKGCTPAGAVGCPKAAAMRLNDRATDGQPHPSAGVLGRKKCPEDLVCMLARQSHTGIADRD